ncbi:MAG TPA: TetR/AcrR family transcriptional regulator [Thermomicrobiales bacterium]|nr:TetR/AcrR family transcriptional regulator [Thermomicrobiales bacterium]
MNAKLSTTAPKPATGRPRSADADRAILQAAFHLLMEQGYARMSVEGVAAAAGVGKTTIYRRYPGKQDLVVAVVDHFFPVDDLPQTGDTRQELSNLLTRAFEGLSAIHGVRLVGMALAEEGANPELFEFFRSRVIKRRRAILRGILERGVARGDVRPDADLELAMDMAFGAFVGRHLSGLAMSDEWLEHLVAALWRFLAVNSGLCASDSEES